MKDQIGNDLEIGDLVMVNLAHGDKMIGRVADFKQGGVMLVQGRKNNDQRERAGQVPEAVTPAQLRVQMIYDAITDPRQPVFQEIIKLQDNQGPEVKQGFIKAKEDNDLKGQKTQ